MIEPFLSDPDFTLYVGDVRDVLPKLPADSVDCVASSPPFYGLRDYNVEGQIGLEASPDQWAQELVRVFRECRRVLKPTGTLWIECGDSYAGSVLTRPFRLNKGLDSHADDRPPPSKPVPADMKPKDLIGAPWLLAFALRADGWYLRQCLIWHKPNCMPESAKDRCTTAHSYVFMLSKKPRYWFDADAISEPAAWERWGDQTTPKYEGTQTATGWMQPRQIVKSKAPDGWDTGAGAHGSVHRNGREKGAEAYVASGSKNARSVWTIPTQGYPEAHFATWPEKLAERIIKAGCPEGGTILDPFMGAGTTALVARRLSRHSVGVELNEEYAAMCARRLGQQSLLS